MTDWACHTVRRIQQNLKNRAATAYWSHHFVSRKLGATEFQNNRKKKKETNMVFSMDCTWLHVALFISISHGSFAYNFHRHGACSEQIPLLWIAQ